MSRSVTVLTACLGLLAAACSREDAQQPTSPVEAPPHQPAAAIGYACESGRTVAVAYPDAQTARLTYDGRDHVLTSVASASGARFVGEGLEWRSASRGAQEQATLSRLAPGADQHDQAGGAIIERCSRPVAAAVPPPSGAPCASADLRLAVEGGDAGMGHRVTTLALRNAGTAACTVTGYPSVSLLDGEGKLMTSVRAVQAPGSYLAQGRAPTPVEIRPQQAAWFDLAWTVIPHEDKGETTCPSAKTVRVTAPGAATAIALPLAFAPCGGQVEVSPLRPVADAPAQPASTAAN
ncbi:Membrane-bound lysozyme-inhibitor of c-type lysozyme [compost metagenome]